MASKQQKSTEYFLWFTSVYYYHRLTMTLKQPPVSL